VPRRWPQLPASKTGLCRADNRALHTLLDAWDHGLPTPATHLDAKTVADFREGYDQANAERRARREEKEAAFDKPILGLGWEKPLAALREGRPFRQEGLTWKGRDTLKKGLAHLREAAAAMSQTMHAKLVAELQFRDVCQEELLDPDQIADLIERAVTSPQARECLAARFGETQTLEDRDFEGISEAMSARETANLTLRRTLRLLLAYNIVLTDTQEEFQ